MNSPITIVTGLPRSGTSMMMRMLQAGGMEVLTDHLREADDDNPNGYYEFEKVKEIKANRSWLPSTRGKVIKMVSMLLYELPPDHHYRIVFIKRDLREICESQRIMLARNGSQPTLKDQELIAEYQSHLREVESWLSHQQNMEVLSLVYGNIIDNPEENIHKINVFFNGRLAEGPMIKVIDKSLYRQRKDDTPQMCSKDEHEKAVREADNVAIQTQLQALGYM
jgi:hypothetical protein